MDQVPIEPLDTGLRNRRGKRRRPIWKQIGCLLVDRRTWLIVSWVIKVIVYLAQQIDSFKDGS